MLHHYFCLAYIPKFTYPLNVSAALTLDPTLQQNLLEATSCPDGFEYNRDTRSCYLFGADRITWRMAREKCMIMGADLVTIETSREQRYITDKARARSGKIEIEIR